MSTIVTLWWLFYWTTLGLCVGSFLNVVIYRLPRNRSLRSPLWSACPYCRRRIQWYDNLPIVSFILLRGRCRSCHAPISTRYPVVEATMALIVLMLLDAFFIGRARTGLSDSQVGLTDLLFYDWPILIAHIVLFAALFSMSAIDLEQYWVDIRFTNFATIAGFVLHVVWSPRSGATWHRPSDLTAVMSVFAIVGLIVTWVVVALWHHEEYEPAVDGEALGEPEPDDTPLRRERAPLEAPPRLAGWTALFILIALFCGLFLIETAQTPSLKFAPRALLPLAFMFLLVVSESTVSRPADQEIAEALEEERFTARGMVLTELMFLLPCIFAALVGWWMLSSWPGFAGSVDHALHDPSQLEPVSFFRNWAPARGLATAASGFIVAGAVGWFVRIAFTLVFGKEAFGTGDIHLMAAAGCIAGWPVVVLGFFLACGLALIGWLLVLPFKRTRAIPLGPWLCLGFLTTTVFLDRILALPVIARTVSALRMLFADNSQGPTQTL